MFNPYRIVDLDALERIYLQIHTYIHTYTSTYIHTYDIASFFKLRPYNILTQLRTLLPTGCPVKTAT